MDKFLIKTPRKTQPVNDGGVIVEKSTETPVNSDSNQVDSSKEKTFKREK